MRLQNLYLPTEQVHMARPDTVREITQLPAGQVVIKFLVYNDLNGIINKHLSRTAVAVGGAYRILDDTIITKGGLRSSFMRVEKMPTHTLEEGAPASSDLLSVGNLGIKGIDTLGPQVVINAGLLAIREELNPGTDLEVGPGLYIHGANDVQALYLDGYMAIALDSDVRLAGLLPVAGT